MKDRSGTRQVEPEAETFVSPGSSGSLRDSAQKEAEAASQLGADIRRLLIEPLLTGILVTNPEGKILGANQARDNGSGIPAELIDSLFSPFVKGEGGGSGTGPSPRR